MFHLTALWLNNMLDNETRRRIDTARDILVGKVPDPKSQVEQITIALIYKFMDDMDKEAVEFGGEATFFTEEYEKYAWTKIFDPKLGGHEMLNLYGDAIVKLNQNPNIPQLFRDIFKNAYLPYRDPETLKLFLKTINEFKYDHSEMLGDAFEYLLSVLGSQGDAGQFRTPRHIIDFIVQILEPKKGESICDPACGTAGFLISSYKYIVEQNTKKTKGDLLTPDDRKKLMQNFVGYDISPDMVRLSLVNLYLHGFTTPRIYEYDSLTSEERWNEYFDVILANPPFMTPKGGVKPHKKFTIQAKKSEVLFTDFIAEHINPTTGRAAIIVPNGIIGTSQTAYIQLRKLLINQGLYAVISLPAGCFNPYSGVQTSILFLDKKLSKFTDEVLFIKVESDGFDLGSQRKQIDKNDLPTVKDLMLRARFVLSNKPSDYKTEIRNLLNESGMKIPESSVLFVSKKEILESKDAILSGEKYHNLRQVLESEYPLVKLKDLIKIQSGFAFDSKLFNEDLGFPLIRIRDIKTNSTKTKYTGEYKEEYIVKNGDLIIGMDGEFNCVIWQGNDAILNQRVCRITEYNNCLKEYIYKMLYKPLKEIENDTIAVTVKHISVKQIYEIEIPFPPIEVQQEIVDYFNACEQEIIDYKNMIAEKQSDIQNRISELWGEIQTEETI